MNLSMLIQKLFSKLNFQKRKQIRSSFLAFATKYKYLESGTYKIVFKDKPCIYHKGSEECIFKSTGRDFRCNQGSSGFVIDNNNCGDFCGQFAIMTLNNSFKCFDCKSNRLITVQASDSSRVIADNLLYFNRYLRNTFLEVFDDFVCEKVVIGKSVRELDAATQLSVYRQIIKEQIYLITHAVPSNSIDSSTQVRNINDYLTPLIASLLTVCCKKSEKFSSMPSTRMHCDIHFGNVIREYESNDLYYIDFEYCREEIVIYDIINCAFVEFVDSNSHLAIDYLLDADNVAFDFQKIIIGFQPNDIKLLVYRFLISRITFDINNAQKRFSQNEFTWYYNYIYKRYNRFIEYIEGWRK